MSELQGLLSRLWADLVARPGGPLEFRLLLQPFVPAHRHERLRVHHLPFMVELRRQRAEMQSAGLIHGEGRFPTSLTLITAVAPLVIGLFAFASTVLKAGPFG